MALNSYSGLIEALSAWLDGSDLGGREADMIALCEDEINARLAAGLNDGRVIRPMMQVDAILIDQEYADLPDGNTVLPIALEIDQLSAPWAVRYIAPESLIRMNYGVAAERQAIARVIDGDPPRYYTLIGDRLRLFPAPDGAFASAITRFVKIPALSEAVTTNWVLSSHRNAYLYGALAQAELFGWNADSTASWAQLFANAVDGIIARYPVPSNNAPLTSELHGTGAVYDHTYWAGDL